MKRRSYFFISDDQNKEIVIASEEKPKKRRKGEKIQKTPIKQPLNHRYEIQENIEYSTKLLCENIQNPSSKFDKENELTKTQVVVPKKQHFYEKIKNKKKNSKKNIEILNKPEESDESDIFDLLNTKVPEATKKKRRRKTYTFSQEINNIENTSISDCIEVEFSDNTSEKIDELCSSNIAIDFSQEKYNSSDIVFNDVLTSFVDTCSSATKKDKNLPMIISKENIEENFNKIAKQDFDDYNLKNELVFVENSLSDSIISSKKNNYENKKKQNIFEDKSILNNFKNHILEKLTGRKYAPIIGLETEYRKLRELLYQTINLGESNSCLIIGPKSSGKSNILDTAIISLNEFSSQFFVVRLNGIIQTDDKLALKEIARQLNVEMNLDAQENVASSFSDNLFKILTILSHPRELNLVCDDKPFEESDLYCDTLSSNNITSVSVIFILDNFDLFTLHHRQTLLYNLFDISQTKKAPIAVIGLTCTLDSVESLEKRVKSRFSHRIIQIKYPDNLELFIKICRSGLTIDYEPSSKLSLKEKELLFIKNWNKHVDDLFEEGNVTYKLVKTIFMTSKDVREFYSRCIIPITSLSMPTLQEDIFLSQDIFHLSNKIELLNGISLLQFSLLICAAKINARDTNTLNFNMVYKEYRNLVTKSVSSSVYSIVKNTSIRLWERNVLLDAWEKLCDLNFLHPCGNIIPKHLGILEREFRMYFVEITLIDLISYMDKVKTIPTILRKWSKEVI